MLRQPPKQFIVCLLVLFAALSSVANAGYQTGHVISLHARADGIHWARLSGVYHNKPDCVANQSYWLVKDENSIAGETQISTLLRAYATGRTVTVFGLNACSRSSNGEDIAAVSEGTPALLQAGSAYQTLFDPLSYLVGYADLGKAFGMDDYAAALRHWLMNGVREGRAGSELNFDPQAYLARYADLRQQNFSYRDALKHWLDHGLREGRDGTGALRFDPKFYLKRHGDVQHAYGPENYAAGFYHWLDHGIDEGRQAFEN